MNSARLRLAARGLRPLAARAPRGRSGDLGGGRRAPACASRRSAARCEAPRLRIDLEAEILEQVKTASPSFFERLVVELLVRMGYGGTLRKAGQAVGKSGDAGIDGIITTSAPQLNADPRAACHGVAGATGPSRLSSIALEPHPRAVLHPVSRDPTFEQRAREAAGGGRRRNKAQPARRAPPFSTPQACVRARGREKRNGEPFAAAHPLPPPSQGPQSRIRVGASRRRFARSAPARPPPP